LNGSSSSSQSLYAILGFIWAVLNHQRPGPGFSFLNGTYTF
jgi:hypothetical protein